MSQRLRAVPKQKDTSRAAAIERANRLVDAISALDFQGNTIPHSWFLASEFRTKKGGLNFLAMIVLADIVWWYRSVPVRDEESNQIIDYKRQFAEDMLRMTYSQWADKFKVSKWQITSAVTFLVRKGLIRREFRTVVLGGIPCANQVHVEPVYEAIERITFKRYTAKREGGVEIPYEA